MYEASCSTAIIVPCKAKQNVDEIGGPAGKRL